MEIENIETENVETGNVETGNIKTEGRKWVVTFLLQLLKAACYVGLYFGIQECVSMVVIMAFSLTLGIQLGLSGQEQLINDQEYIYSLLVEEVTVWTPVILIVSGILSMLALWVFFVLRKKKFLQEVQFRKFAPKNWLSICFASVALCFFINFGLNLLPISEEVLLSYQESSEALLSGPFWLLFVSNVIMAPVCEEIIFRGLVFDRLKKAMPVWPAILVTSAIFAVMHGQILWMCYTFLVGVVLCVVANKANSIIPSIIVHMLFNLFGTCIVSLFDEVSMIVCLALTLVGFVALVLTFCATGASSTRVSEIDS